MHSDTALLLGRGVWFRDLKVWRNEPFESARQAVDRLSEILSGPRSARWTLVFEPEGASHHAVESPRVGRSVFASLSRVRSEYPVVESEDLGWGIEHPEPAQGGTYSTLLHSETTPGLARIQDACTARGSRLCAAWSAYTALNSCATPGNSTARTRLLAIVLPGFVAVATSATGRRSFKAWAGPMSERDWKAFSGAIGDGDSRSAGNAADPGMRRGAIGVVAEGDPALICPIWSDIRVSGRVGAVMGMDALAAAARRIPQRHPANLAEAFPVPRNLDPWLRCAVLAGAGAAIWTGVLGAVDRSRLASEGAATAAREALLEARLAALTRNESEMDRLESEAPADPRYAQAPRHEALAALAALIPDALTVTSLAISRDNEFVVEAEVVGSGFDDAGLRQALERSCLRPDSHDGWSFNAGSGRLRVRGRLEGTHT